MNRKRPKIAIISRESNKRTRDISMLEEELLKRGCDVKVMCRLLKKEKSLKALGYIGHIMKQEAAILASDVVVLDTYCIPASMIPHRKGTKVVQMWHALGAIKKFGWQTVGKEGGSSEKTAKLMKMHHGYDHVVCASDVTAEFFSEAFRTDRSRIVKYGLPRIDYINSVVRGERHDDVAERIFEKYPQLRKSKDGQSKPTILYAPTFRRGKTVDVQSLINAFDPEKYDLIIKLHPIYRGELSESDVASGNVIFDDFVVEATIADKPLFIYAYDLEEYKVSTGLNVDFDSEPIAPYVFRDEEALAAEIGKVDYDMNALRAFRDRYIDIDTGDGTSENYCTAALADFILSLA